MCTRQSRVRLSVSCTPTPYSPLVQAYLLIQYSGSSLIFLSSGGLIFLDQQGPLGVHLLWSDGPLLTQENSLRFNCRISNSFSLKFSQAILGYKKYWKIQDCGDNRNLFYECRNYFDKKTCGNLLISVTVFCSTGALEK